MTDGLCPVTTGRAWHGVAGRRCERDQHVVKKVTASFSLCETLERRNDVKITGQSRYTAAPAFFKS